MKRLIPAYTWHGELQQRIVAERIMPGDLVILNPSNGPQPDDGLEASNVKAAAKLVESCGAYPFGYVALSYGYRDLHGVIGDVLTWNSNHFGVKNVFFDEVPSYWQTGHIGRLTSLVKRVPSPSLVRAVFNPGVPMPISWRSVPEAVVVTTEGPTLQDLKGGGRGRRAALLHSTGDPGLYAAIEKAGFEYGYVTADTTPNPWDGIPR